MRFNIYIRFIDCYQIVSDNPSCQPLFAQNISKYLFPEYISPSSEQDSWTPYTSHGTYKDKMLKVSVLFTAIPLQNEYSMDRIVGMVYRGELP